MAVLTETAARPTGHEVQVPPAEANRLARWNLLAGLFHLAQAVAIVVLSTDFALPVTATFLDVDPATLREPPASDVLFDLRIAWAVAAFSLLSSLAHFIVAGPARSAYEANLRRGRNPFRWAEYSLSASVMIVVIAMLVGIFDVAALALAFAATAGMIAFGHVMETTNPPGRRVDWTPFWFGSALGAVPWVMIAVYLVGAASPPGFVYAIFFSIFVLFNVFPINMVLQYRGRGRFADYLVGERVYIALSFVAKTALAWQVFGGTLR